MAKYSDSQIWMYYIKVSYCRTAQRLEGPLYYIFKKYFFKKSFYGSKLAKWSNFMHGWLCRVVKVSKRARKCWKKPQIWFKTRFPKKILLTNLKYFNSYNTMKKKWCQYITLGIIFSRLVKLTYHFWINSQQLSTTL